MATYFEDYYGQAAGFPPPPGSKQAQALEVWERTDRPQYQHWPLTAPICNGPFHGWPTADAPACQCGQTVRAGGKP